MSSIKSATRGGCLPESCLPAFLFSPIAQNIIVSLICFCTSGIYNAMSGLGSVGGDDPTIAAIGTVALNGVFMLTGVFGGAVFNLVGPRPMLTVAGGFYALYSLSVWIFGTYDQAWFFVLCSALLGAAATGLWTAQGAITMSYCTESEKGTFFGVFWFIFNFGAVIGGMITFASNYDLTGSATTVNDGTYFAFVAIMAASCFLGLFVVNPAQVKRSDGSAITFEKSRSISEQIKETGSLFFNRTMLLLAPLFVFSNWMYTYDHQGLNGQLFNPRTRGFNVAMFNAAQMVGAVLIGYFVLDKKGVSRRGRALIGFAVVMAFNLGLYIYYFWLQFSYKPFMDYPNDTTVDAIWDKDSPVCGLVGPPLQPQPTGLECTVENSCYNNGTFYEPPACAPAGFLSGQGQLIDVSDGAAWAAPGLGYMFGGMADALIQSYAYWLMGAKSNDPGTLASYIGFYKFAQNFGVVVSWALEAAGLDNPANKIDYRWQLVVTAAIFLLALPGALVAALEVKQTTDSDDDEIEKEKQVYV